MPAPTLHQILEQYVRVTGSYWWLLLLGVTIPFVDAVNWHLPRPIHLRPWMRLTIAFLCLAIAQFLAYRNAFSNLAQVIEEKRQSAITINQKDIEIANLNSELSKARKKVPLTDMQLEVDAYRLAEDIDSWSRTLRTLYKPSESGRPIPMSQDPGVVLFNNPPDGWYPGQAERNVLWVRYISEAFKDKFQARVLFLEGRFKERGIVSVPDSRIEQANGPLGIRAAINYLRSSASGLATRQVS